MTTTGRVEGLVSVVIPAYNRAELLAHTVKSVLGQTYRAFEIILVDDGSTDQTPAVADQLVKDHPGIIRYLRQENAGPGPARETGRRAARGEFLQYLDSDDVIDARKFERQVTLLRQQPELDIAYGITRLVDEQGTVLKPVFRWTGEKRTSLYPGLLVDRWWSSHTPLWRAAFTDRVGPWSSLRYSEDWEYEARAGALRARLASVGEVVCDVRSHQHARETKSGCWLGYDDQRRFFRSLLDGALAAGVPRETPEMRHFVRWVFSAARKAAAAGEPGNAEALLSLAREASGSFEPGMTLFRAIAGLVGWSRTARWTEQVRSLSGRRAGSDTLKQSWMGKGG